jgi:hypothetical protein
MAHSIAQRCVRRRRDDLSVPVARSPVVGCEQNERPLVQIQIIQCLDDPTDRFVHAFNRGCEDRVNLFAVWLSRHRPILGQDFGLHLGGQMDCEVG